jgi:hypothetical protein
MAIGYRNRQRRLEKTISRIEATRRSIAGHTEAASAHQTWWRRHGRTLAEWRSAIAERQRRRRTARPAIAADRFKRWTSLLHWHPAVLRLRIECWWLALKLGRRDAPRGPRA